MAPPRPFRHTPHTSRGPIGSSTEGPGPGEPGARPGLEGGAALSDPQCFPSLLSPPLAPLPLGNHIEGEWARGESLRQNIHSDRE
eukprot:9189796-Pyramimonas_sp.AAC.1